MRIALIALIFGIVALATTTTATDQPSCPCTRIFTPVCGSDGITYANSCEFKCVQSRMVGRAAEDFKIARGGACEGPEIPEFADL